MTTPTPTPAPAERPKPLTTLAIWLGPTLGLVAGLVGFLVPLGLINQAEAELINEFSVAVAGQATTVFGASSSSSVWAAAAAGLIPLFSTALASFLTARIGRRAVTPTSDPRDEDGVRLVRIDSVIGRASSRPVRLPDPADDATAPIPTAGAHRRVEPNGVADHARPDTEV